MKSISFDNPYWLLIAIPLTIAILVPYFISVSKDNRNKSWIASLVIHIVIVISLTLAAAGLVHTTVMTRTKVYVVADVSYSSERNLDLIDEYISQVSDSLPQNSRLGIVCFGNDQMILTSSGTAIKSVKDAVVDDRGTDIAAALDFTATLFSEGEIKRIVLITDGFDTTYDGNVVSAVDRLVTKGIKLDTIYLDNNLKEGESEVQISDAEFTGATYLDHESTLKMLVESSVSSDVILDLYRKADSEKEYSKINTTVLKVDAGMNIATFDLPTDLSGVFDYKIELSASADTSPYNNEYCFTQTVAGKRNVLLITGNEYDILKINSLYGDSAEIKFCHIRAGNKDIPYSIEDLSQYDEIILSNVDIREINNINAFIDSADTVVSKYGKSLITLGDLYMQNKDDDVFKRLEEILPVNFGNANKDSKLYTIVLDISRSMSYARPAQLILAKDAAIKLLSVLEDEDYVSLITMAGETVVELRPTLLGSCREELYSKIQNFEATQGTLIGEALEAAYGFMNPLDFEEKHIMLISDGKTYSNEPEDALEVAEKLKNADINLSTMSILNHSPSAYHTVGCQLLENLAEVSGGKYYELLEESDLAEFVFTNMADNITESVVEGESAVNIKNFRDDTVEGILSLPNIYGYVNSKSKLDATTVLTVNYRKNESTVVEVPLYAYREHGNGKVASFTSSITGDWLKGWSEETLNLLFDNILIANTPREHINYPYTVNFDYGGSYSSLEIVPAHLNPAAKTMITVTSPSGEVYEEELLFDLNRYYTIFETPEIGRYHIEIMYSFGSHSFASSTYFTVPYYNEYNSFAAFDIGAIHSFMHGTGKVYTDGNVNLETDRTEVATYERSFRLPLLVFAIVLFVLDVFVRKFKHNKKAKKDGKHTEKGVKA